LPLTAWEAPNDGTDAGLLEIDGVEPKRALLEIRDERYWGTAVNRIVC
jgi:hypothetical protein